MDSQQIIPIPEERIESKIYFLRGRKVMSDHDLAVLYGVDTRSLNQAVKRNSERFPEDFMFQLTLDEANLLTSQFVMSKRGKGGSYWLPYVFTEQGIAMLSSVLRSRQAIQVNIQIIRTFTKLRELLADHESLRLKLEDLERRYDSQFKIVFDALRRMFTEEDEQKPEIGFRA